MAKDVILDLASSKTWKSRVAKIINNVFPQEVKNVNAPEFPRLWATQWGMLTGEQLKMFQKIQRFKAGEFLQKIGSKSLIEILPEMQAEGISMDDIIAAQSDLATMWIPPQDSAKPPV